MEAIAQDARNLGGGAVAVSCDLRFEEQVENLQNEILRLSYEVDNLSDEVDRLEDWEERLYPARHPIAAAACGLAAVAVVFAWINLAIADIFAAGPNLELSFQRLPARDATTSVAWAVYALILLAIYRVIFGEAKNEDTPVKKD